MRRLALASATAILCAAPAFAEITCRSTEQMASMAAQLGFELAFVGAAATFPGGPVKDSSVVLLVRRDTGEWLLVGHDASGQACIFGGGPASAYVPPGDPA